MTYLETLKYLGSFINYEKITVYSYKRSLKLERITDFLETIGNPQESLRCIHIAGTKGKGSTCAFIANILREAEFKVGLYTSPHLLDFRERIRILKPINQLSNHRLTKTDFEGMISKKELIGLVEKLKPAIERYNRVSKYSPLSFFEVYTALAFIYFKEKRVDFAVLETGLGGRLDATNVVNSYVCAITPISYEHTQKLGNTLREIAGEKAGIIKAQSSKLKTQNLIVISAPQEREALQVIRDRCKKIGAKLFRMGKDIGYEKTEDGFRIKGIFDEYKNLKIRLIGKHQILNATVTVGVIEALRFYGINIGIDAIRKGLYNTIWPGRCEILSKNPWVILDGAQNVASSQALKETIFENFSDEGKRYNRLILVLGISKDKDIPGICREICPIADEIILTSANNPRAIEADGIEKIISHQLPEVSSQIIKTQSVREARTKALAIAKKDDLILVCGSLFVVGEFRDGKL
jgi:dihydrofolate synthase/folylpolyglutamate synthase